MKVLVTLLSLVFAASAYAHPAINYNKQQRVVEKIVDLILDNKTDQLENIFVSTETLNLESLSDFVTQASRKIHMKGSKRLYASRVTGDHNNGEQTLYEFAFFYYFKGAEVFYYKINIIFENNTSLYKPVDIEFMTMKELSLLDVEVATAEAVSPFARN